MPLPTLTYLTSIHFAPGIGKELSAIATQHGVTRPLVVTDAGIRSAGLLDRLRLPNAPIFDAVPANPTESAALAGVEILRAQNCDGLIAVGGGSPIDCAKAIALLATHPPPLRQYAMIEGGVPRITANKPPLIAVPTTAGTGSEVGRGALITFDVSAAGGGAADDKLALISPHLIPTAAVCDPELTLHLPPPLTAGTGM